MTKQEVQNNIRYNENLVNQYQREINNLDNQIRTLNSRISQYNGQINNLRNNKQNLENQLDELQRLHNKVTGLLDAFSSRQAKRVANFNKNNSVTGGLRFIKTYIEGMKDLLSGQEYRNTYNGLTTAIDKVKKQIQAKQREIESVGSQINNAQRNADGAQREINNCRNRINQLHNDLSYRKRRIQYWQSQMATAT